MGKIQKMDDLVFETVVEESGVPIDFSEVGAVFVGEYLGAEEINPTGKDEDAFTQHKFRDPEGVTRVCNGGYKLNVGLEGIAKAAIVRITRTGDVPMSDPAKNAMRDFRIEVGK
jgi:hypothetical protein